MQFADLTESLPEPIRDQLQTPIGIGAVILVGAILLFIVAHFSGKMWHAMFGPPPKSPQDAFQENLTEYPPAPGVPGPRRLTVEGISARIRLIVVAPVGKSRPVDSDTVNDLLNSVIRGIKDVIVKDRPRIRIWPPQLSNTGFAPTFHKLTLTNMVEHEPSHWVLIAGPASAAGVPILLGLGLLADDANELGKLTTSPERWAETVRVVTVEGN